MDKHQLQKLRDLPIEGVAERLGLRVDTHHKSLCPFHSDHHASLSFHRGRNTYRCFVCGAHGGTIDLVMRHLNLDFKAACRWLADEHNIILEEWKPTTPTVERKAADISRYARFFEHPWLSEEARHFLFEERKLDPRVITWCRLTSWRDKQGINWLQIPYYDMDGKLIGIQNRNLNPPDGGIRFRFPPASRCSIYNLPVLRLLKPGEDLYITEGCSDCWAMLSSGHKAIAIPSATLLTPKDKELLSTLNSKPYTLNSQPYTLNSQHYTKNSQPYTKNSNLYTKFHMYPDRDAPGERLFLQLREVLPDLQHHHLPPGCKDYADYYVSKVTKQQVNRYESQPDSC